MNTLAKFWCFVAHDSAMWPIHGHYECRVCGREYPVAWSNAKNEARPKRSDLGVYEPAVVHGR
jgi:hypothetical protein